MAHQPSSPSLACMPACRRRPEHLTGLWLANLSNSILCFTYFKAIVNTMLSKVHLKGKQGFKVRGGGGSASAGRQCGVCQCGVLVQGASAGRQYAS